MPQRGPAEPWAEPLSALTIDKAYGVTRWLFMKDKMNLGFGVINCMKNTYPAKNLNHFLAEQTALLARPMLYRR
jgi:hypothetical protein